MGDVNQELAVVLKNWWERTGDVTQLIHGSLEVIDPLNEITITQSTATWNGLETGEMSSDQTFEFSDFSHTPRTVLFRLTLDFENPAWDDQVLEFPVILRGPGTSPDYDLAGTAEIISSEMVIGDVDYDGTDELAVATSSASNPRINYYNGVWNTLSTNSNVIADPVFADIMGDPEKEVIAGDEDGTLYIWDAFGTLQTSITTGYGFLSIAAEDVNDDGSLEIVGNGNPDKIIVVHSFRDTPVVWIIDIDNTSEAYTMLSPLAVGNVNLDSFKEIVVLMHDDDYNLHMAVVRAGFGGVSMLEIEQEQIWTSAGAEDHRYLGVSNIILLKPIKHVNNDIYHHQIYFQMANGEVQIDPGSPRYSLSYQTYCYDASDGISLVWDQTPGNIDHLAEVNSDFDFDWHITAGDINGNEGKEIITSFDDAVLDDLTGYVHTGVFEPLENYTQIYFSRYMRMIDVADLDDNGINEIIAIDADDDGFFRQMTVVDENKNIIPEYSTPVVGDSGIDEIKDIAIGSVFSTTGTEMYILTKKGYFYLIDFSSSETNDWEQEGGNERKTCCYYQKIPGMISGLVPIEHDVIVSGHNRQDTGLIDITKPLTEVRFEHEAVLRAEDEMYIGGTSADHVEYPVRFSGLCPESTSFQNYWTGIEMGRQATTEIENTHIYNAQVGVYYTDSGNHILDDNTFKYNQTGTTFYNSSFQIKRNIYQYNRTGVASYRQASPVVGNSTTPGQFTNTFYTNETGGYSHQACPEYKGHNNFDNLDMNLDHNGTLLGLNAVLNLFLIVYVPRNTY